MRIVMHEVRKMWNIKILLAIAILCGLFFFMYMEWHVRHAQAGATVEALWVRELTERYGTRVTTEQMEAFFAEQFPLLIAELEYRLSLDPIFADMGIFTYVDFIRARQAAEWEDLHIFRRMYSIENNRVAEMLYGLQQLQSMWDSASSQISMDIEMERFGYNDWFYNMINAALASNDVLDFVSEQRTPLLRQADEFIANNVLFAENGIANYEQFLEVWNSRNTFNGFEHYRTVWEFWRILLGVEANFVERKLIDLDGIYTMYTHAQTHGLFETEITWWLDARAMRWAETTDFARQRIDTIIENQDYLNIMPWCAFSTTRTYFGWLAIMVALATTVLIMPIVAVDRMRNVQSVQYSSKIGRRLMFWQIVAVMLSSILITTLLLVIFGGIYFYWSGVHFFWNHNIFSFTHQFVALFNFTFGQYVIALVGITYAVGLASALLTLVISRFSRNLMIGTIKIIPLFAGLAAFAVILNSSGASAPFHMAHRFYMWTNIVGIEAIVCAMLVVLSLVAALAIALRERRVDMR